MQKIPHFDFSTFELKHIAKEFLKAPWMNTYRVLPLRKQEKTLILGVDDPSQEEMIRMIQFYTGLSVSLVILDSNTLDELRRALLEKVPQKNFLPNELVEYCLVQAIDKNASDIHFEPYEQVYRIRFRLDGLLAEITTAPGEMKEQIIAYLKVMAHLDTSERRQPQEGRFQFKTNDEKRIDCRMSTCPTVNGEKIVVRLLPCSTMQLDVHQLGFNAAQEKLFLSILKQPQGMIFVTGPTGSGKTVTLYTALSLLNKPEKNICTVEDPVEIKLPGINQVGINLKTGLTFAKVIRAFLRQDPDIIMIGEIRDLETAQIAIGAAQTGHLVFSTLHSNGAVETITRLLHMGLKPFQIADAIKLIIAQRLVRQLCKYCHAQTKDCKHCYQGYKGRIGIFELLPLTTDFVIQIEKGLTDIGYLNELAKKQGMITLAESGFEKIALNLTTEEEVRRVLG
jgi:type IV pilus assembly protein PilB